MIKPLSVAPLFNEHVSTHRGSGATTAMALYTLAVAAANPGRDVEIRDHVQGSEQALLHIVDVVSVMAVKLKLDCLIDRRRYTIQFPVRGVKEMQYVRR